MGNISEQFSEPETARGSLLALLFPVLMLILLGAVALYSASMAELVPQRFYSHVLWTGIGMGVAVVFAVCPYGWWRRAGVPRWLMVITLLGLVLVLVPGIGQRINGARRWLWCGGQVSELAKLALIVFLADYAARNQHNMRRWKEGFLVPSLVIAMTGGLIFLEPDWGTALLVCFVGFIVLLVGGARWLHVVPPAIPALGALSWLVAQNPERIERLMVFRNPELYRDGPAWQIWHSMLAIGSGGPWPHALGSGTHKFGFVPEIQTDFILALIGEELGFVGTAFVVVLFCAIVIWGVVLALRMADIYARLLVVGITFLIGFQAFINMGVASCALPNKGIPLPFVSYGGSSTIIMLAAVGLLAGVAWRGRVLEYPVQCGTETQDAGGGSRDDSAGESQESCGTTNQPSGTPLAH